MTVQSFVILPFFPFTQYIVISKKKKNYYQEASRPKWMEDERKKRDDGKTSHGISQMNGRAIESEKKIL